MRAIRFTAAATLCALAAGAASAAVIVSPLSATATSEYSATYDIGNTIDQSGLSSTFVSGVTDFDAYLATNPMHTLIANDNEWFSANGVTRASVVYDLGSVMTIDRLALWNEEFSGFGTGLISISLDNALFTTVTTINPVDSPSGLDYGAQVFGLGTVAARYVQFDISGCPQPDGSSSLLCGIGEVAFSVTNEAPPGNNVPEPGSLALIGLGALGLLASRRRK